MYICDIVWYIFLTDPSHLCWKFNSKIRFFFQNVFTNIYTHWLTNKIVNVWICNTCLISRWTYDELYTLCQENIKCSNSIAIQYTQFVASTCFWCIFLVFRLFFPHFFHRFFFCWIYPFDCCIVGSINVTGKEWKTLEQIILYASLKYFNWIANNIKIELISNQFHQRCIWIC